MPRNAQGVYSLPAGNPVVTGTTIDSTWANPTMADIASEITGSLPRNGAVGMTGPLILSDDATVALEATTLQQMEAADDLKAPLASPTLTGIPLAPTASVGTNSTQIATTEFVAALGALKANLASPVLTGSPLAPTASAGSNTTQIATTAFVAALGALKANLASPAFTGSPTAPTPATSDNDTSIATTAFIKNLIAANNTYTSGANGVAMHNSDTNLLICYKAVGGTSLNIATGALYRTDNIDWTFPLGYTYAPFVSMCIIPCFVSCMVRKCNIINKWFCRMGNKPKCTNDFRLFNCYRN